MSELNIIYEDEILLVCNKPSGLMVEPDRNNFPNLLNQVKIYLKQKSGNANPYVQHLHRLDRVTSGVVLFTKKREHLKNLSEQFAQRQVEKYYQAITRNCPEKSEGVLENWHRKEKKKAVIYQYETQFSELAKLQYKVVKRDDGYLWYITLHTGKYHQIRAQLAHINCPILGDILYDSAENYLLNSIALRAVKLIIKHPVTNQLLSFEVAGM